MTMISLGRCAVNTLKLLFSNFIFRPEPSELALVLRRHLPKLDEIYLDGDDEFSENVRTILEEKEDV